MNGRASFTQMLRGIDDSDLDVYEFRLWCHIWRVGVSWESIRTMATKCRMSVGKASEARNSLLERNLLAYTSHKGRLGLTAVLVDDEPVPDVDAGATDSVAWSYQQYTAACHKGTSGNRCVYCGRPEVASFDHWIPRARGGSDDDSNLVPACSICNNGKGTLTGNEFAAVLMERGWMVDDRSQHEQLQQLGPELPVVSVHHMNRVFTTRTECSPHEQSVHHTNAILSMPIEVNNMKGEGEKRERANGRSPSPSPAVVPDELRSWCLQRDIPPPETADEVGLLQSGAARLWLTVTQLWPGWASLREVVKALGPQPDEPKLREVWRVWTLNGYSTRNLAGILERYQRDSAASRNGSPVANGNGRAADVEAIRAQWSALGG